MADYCQEVSFTPASRFINRHAPSLFSNRLLTRSKSSSRIGRVAMRIRKPVFLAVLLACFSIMGGTALAQNLQNGAIRGTVSDTSHASVATAKLTLTNTATGIRRELTVESDGSYVFENVAPGEYTITAEADGFGVVTVKQIVVNIGASLLQGVPMPLTSQHQAVEVIASTGQIFD